MCTHAPPRELPSLTPTATSARSASMFLLRMLVGECRLVSLASGVMKASRTLSMLITAVRWMARRNPARDVFTTEGASDASNDMENTASIAGHATSSMGRTHAGSVAVWNPLASRLARARTSSSNLDVSTPPPSIFLPATRLISTSMPRRLLMSFMARFKLEPDPALLASALAASNSGSSSFMRISLCTMLSYSSPRWSPGRSAPSSMPRLLRRNPSRVILFFTCGLCASVFSMITLNDSTYAVSALLYCPGFCLQYRSANFSISRSIFCDSPGRRNPSRNLRMASSSISPWKSSAST
mmetsp:Transcript_34101/g.83591  ORF Transcript_34101/g.83591 Transcript_34101/m.83591 type:complete len:298 (-) Transcript_34101:305-1198(-)